MRHSNSNNQTQHSTRPFLHINDQQQIHFPPSAKAEENLFEEPQINLSHTRLTYSKVISENAGGTIYTLKR